MADFGTLFMLMLTALTFVIVGMFFIVYIMIIGVREKNKAEVQESSQVEDETMQGCPHFFGYLIGYPKNQPIPDECFGCVRAIECMNEQAPTESVTEVAADSFQQQ